MRYQKDISTKRSVMVEELDGGMFMAGICNNGYAWSTVTTYSVEMLAELRNALTKFIDSKENTNDPKQTL